jgi:glycosyltransferase involved in cell wall biosynthesis
MGRALTLKFLTQGGAVLNVAVINIPLPVPHDPTRWITVPPPGYGGIQWVVAHLVDGLVALGHTVYLLGAPESVSTSKRLQIIPAGHPDDIYAWLRTSNVDIMHDHANGIVRLTDLDRPFVSTHHLTGRPRIARNAVYLSYAQRSDAGSRYAPVIRIPVNPERFLFKDVKAPFLLTLARVSRWKGILEAARYAKAAGLPLRIAGPAWEPEYLAEILGTFGKSVLYLGEVGGEARLQLLADAKAVLVFSQPVKGPWGGYWSEPGATVVSEAAVSGTPVISTNNGCLGEIAPLVGIVLSPEEQAQPDDARRILAALPSPAATASTAIREWGHIRIASAYTQLYHECIRGRQWE